MKFNHINMGRNVFTEVLTGIDRKYVEAAYGIGAKDLTAAEKDKRGRARRWLTDVLNVFAESIDTSFAQAKQLVESGNASKLKDLHARMLPPLHATLEQASKLAQRDPESGQIIETLTMSQLKKQIRDLQKTTQLADEDVVAFVREKWVRALSLPHPAFERHLISGKAQVRQTEKKAPEVKVAKKAPKAKAA